MALFSSNKTKFGNLLQATLKCIRWKVAGLLGEPTPPKTLDWRSQGVMSPVKDQKCTSTCWVCAPVACVEAMNTIVTGRRTTLSVQQIMDTTRIASCGQGDPSIAFQHMLLFGGLATEREYPFTGRYGPCKFLTKEVAITGYTRLPEGDEDALQWAVNVGPVVAVIEAGESFAANDTGVHYEMSRIAALNHCVLVVGYGVDETTGREFWIIRNSYGERWGDKGHARVPRNCVVEEGYCNLAHYAIYPTMAGLNPPFLARQVSYPLAMHYSPCPCVACRVLFPNATRVKGVFLLVEPILDGDYLYY